MTTTDECFICCSADGKTTEENLLDSNGYTSLGYPLITMAYAYNCNCKTLWAHNKCLKTLFTCPSCKKRVTKPNLTANTLMGKYLPLKIVRKYPIKFKQLRNCCAMAPIIILVMLECNKRKIIVLNMYILIIFGIVMLCAIWLIHINDFIKKYWLYDDNTNTFYNN